MEKAGIKDEKVIENLKYMMDMGYTNFQINLSLLNRNNNDMIVAINHICNGMISESMFQWFSMASPFLTLENWENLAS